MTYAVGIMDHSDDTHNDHPSRIDAQLIELEHKLAFQQRGYDQLNAVVLEQQSEIESLRREIASLKQSLEELSTRGDDLPHEKPPHY